MPIGWTKRQLIEQAFSELALAGYVFDITPEEMDDALRKLDTMMATWAGRGIDVGYVLGLSVEDTDVDQPSGLPLVAVQAVYLKLAIEIAAGKGKVLAQSTKANAKSAFDALASYVLRQSPNLTQELRGVLPRGAGNRAWRYAGDIDTFSGD